MEHRRNNEADHAYNMGFTDGYSKGRYHEISVNDSQELIFRLFRLTLINMHK